MKPALPNGAGPQTRRSFLHAGLLGLTGLGLGDVLRLRANADVAPSVRPIRP